MGKNIAYKANRDGVAERFADPAVQKSIEVDLALISYYDELLRDVGSCTSGLRIMFRDLSRSV